MLINNNEIDLTKEDFRAFTAWFHGGQKNVTRYLTDNFKHVSFGKFECERVDFEKVWLGKFVELGWVKATILKEGVAIGMIGTPKYIEYRLEPTEKGLDEFFKWRS